MKKKIKRFIVVLVIAVLSVGCGFLYDRYDHRKKLEEYPRRYQTEISVLSYEYNVPTSVAYTVIRECSGFDAAYRSDRGTGLFSLTDVQYEEIEIRLGNEPENPGLLYQPDTSLRLGIFRLSELFLKYGRWETVFAAFAAGEEAVDTWLGEDGELVSIPDEAAADFVGRCVKTMKMYNSLYEGKNR